MSATWPILGSGRSAVVFDLGGGRVLRRHRTPGYDAAPEAAAMRLAARFGVSVPTVHAVTGAELILDRVDGPTLLDVLLAEPRRAAEAGAVLAGLHDQLDRVEVSGVHGNALVHGDLHPGNVIMTGDGPMLIDWTNQRRGPRGLDVAISWMVLACFLPEEPSLSAVDAVREPLLDAFLGRIDRAAAARAMPEAARIRTDDPSTTAAERYRIEQLCRAEARPWR